MDFCLTQYEGQTVLITGGGGYLGSKLAEIMAKCNSKLVLLDVRFNQISSSLASDRNNVELLKADLTYKESLVHICNQIKPDYIFHFAALLNRSREFELYKRLYEVNVKGTFNLLDALKDIEYKGFYFSSTSEVYGTNNELPFHEEQLPNPVSPYSLTKYMAEVLCRTFSNSYSKPFIILRLFNFFGPGMPSDTFVGEMLSHYREKKTFLMTEGFQKRDLIYIDELIEQILFIAKHNHGLYDIYNICASHSYRMVDVANTFKDITGDEFHFAPILPYRQNEIWEMVGSNQRILSLNYIPRQTALKENLKKLVRQ